MTEPVDHPLAGRTILVVEDEYLIARNMAAALREAGARVLGPARDVGSALDLIQAAPSISAATLDLNLQGDPSYPVIDALRARGVALLLVSGYDADSIPERYCELPRQQKPLAATTLATRLASMTMPATRS